MREENFRRCLPSNETNRVFVCVVSYEIRLPIGMLGVYIIGHEIKIDLHQPTMISWVCVSWAHLGDTIRPAFGRILYIFAFSKHLKQIQVKYDVSIRNTLEVQRLCFSNAS